jgi:hypothetical protein
VSVYVRAGPCVSWTRYCSYSYYTRDICLFILLFSAPFSSYKRTDFILIQYANYHMLVHLVVISFSHSDTSLLQLYQSLPFQSL